MSRRRSTRSAKTNAKLLITSSSKKEQNGDDELKPHKNKGGVVVDPFRAKGPKHTSPSTLHADEGIKIDSVKGSFICQWKARMNVKACCDKAFQTADDLLRHLRTHKNKISGGYACHWKDCSLKKQTFFKDEDDLEKHSKKHVLNVPIKFGDAEDKVDSDDDNDDDIGSDFLDSSDEEVATKRKKLVKKSTPSEEISIKNVRSEPANPVCLSFYRFTCMWVVPFTIKNRDGSEVKTEVTCMRKFTVMEESLDHLKGHHMKKLKSQNMPLKCYWKDCTMGETLFGSMEELADHIKIHVEEKMITFNANGPRVGSGSESNIMAKISEVASTSAFDNEVSSTSVTDFKSATPGIYKIPEIPENTSTDDDDTNGEVDSPLASLFLALMCTSVKANKVLCPLSKMCAFCRFLLWKARQASTDFLSSYEFNPLKNLYLDDASKALSLAQLTDKLFTDIVTDEAKCHKSAIFMNTYWFASVRQEGSRCIKHPLRKNLSDLFPYQYQNCRICSRSVASWPTKSQENLVFKLDHEREKVPNIHYPLVLNVLDQKHDLKAVVCQGSSHSFTVYLYMKNKYVVWGSPPTVVSESKILRKRNAILVVYTKRDSALDTTTTETYSEEENLVPCFKEEDTSEVVSFKEEPDDYDVLPPDYMKPEDVCQISHADTTTGIDEVKKEIDVKSVFVHRKITNARNDPFISSFLHALLQTSLTLQEKKSICSSNCYFCKMISFIKNVIVNPEELPVEASGLSDIMEQQEMNEYIQHGNFISNFIGGITMSEMSNHGTTDTKYKFLIRMQKTCSCEMSCQVYHWNVTPTKKHQYLLDLMMECQLMCTQCNKMTNVHPIQMPENLIVTIEKSPFSPEGSVHFPDEWSSGNSRYMLASIVVNKNESGGTPKYYSYCRVFGRWMLYDGKGVSCATSSDVLGNEMACVLVYVKNEIEVQSLESVLQILM